MAHITLKIYPDGRIERSEDVSSWREREELLAYALYLQPGLAALDVSARIWRELRQAREGREAT